MAVKLTYPLVITLLLASLVTSCKKDRTCECATSVTQSSSEPGVTYPAQPTRTTSITYTKVKSSYPAIKECVSTVKKEVIPYTSSSKNYEITILTNQQCTVK